MLTAAGTSVMSDAERLTRIELAACYRLAAHYKMTDLIYTHITARVPDEPGHFLINPYGYLWEKLLRHHWSRSIQAAKRLHRAPTG